jgi:hypothetical protein
MSQPANSPQPDGTAKVSFYEKRKKIYAKGVRGYFDNWRIALVIFTQVLFYVSPWLTWNGRQAILLHLVERKFYIFGMVFWPQDVIYLAALLIVSAYALFLVTAVAGRLSVATPARKRSTRRYSCGSKTRSKAIATPASSSTKAPARTSCASRPPST